MNKSTFAPAGNFDEEVIFCLERQMIPVWERFGMEHLAASADTLKEFRRQPLPEQMQTWKKKRKGEKVIPRRGRQRNNMIVAEWPRDDQEINRFPVLIYVRDGQTEFQLGDYVAQCPQGHFLLLKPGVAQPAGANPHLEEPRAGKKCEIWWFHSTANNDFVAMSVCYSVENRHINSGHYYIVEEPQVTQLFQLFVQEMVDQSADYKKTVFASLQMFLLLFLREIKANRFHNRGIDNLPKSASVSASSIEMARQYIAKNLNHPLTIDIVAQAVFMARTNFISQFRRETGQTFREYLTERRLEEAKHWLLNDACSIQDVCVFVGLKSSQFYDLFQRRFGMTPLEFRRKHKNV